MRGGDLEVLFCVRQLKRQDFFCVCFVILFKGNLTDWNPDKTMPVQPCTARGDCVKSVARYSTVNINNGNGCVENTERRSLGHSELPTMPTPERGRCPDEPQARPTRRGRPQASPSAAGSRRGKRPSLACWATALSPRAGQFPSS